MSMVALRTAFARIERGDLKPACALVLLCLANRHNQETGRCDPSVSRIAKDTGLTRKTVQTSLRALEADQSIQTIFRQRSTGRGRANMNSRYRILGGVKFTPTLAKKLRPKQEVYQPSAFDDLALMIDVEGNFDA